MIIEFNSTYAEGKHLRFTCLKGSNILTAFKKKLPQKTTRLYIDYGLKLNVNNDKNYTYAVIGDTHHLPGLLKKCVEHLKQNAVRKIFCYGKPSHYKILRMYGINAYPCPLDIFILEAIDDMEKWSATRTNHISICESRSDYQQRRGFVLDLIENSPYFKKYQFARKSCYMQTLSQTNYHLIVSNGHQLNPQFFFTIAAGAVPIVEKNSLLPYLKMYPDLCSFKFHEFEMDKICSVPRLLDKSHSKFSTHNLKTLMRLGSTSSGELWHTYYDLCNLSLISDWGVSVNSPILLFIYELLQQVNNYLAIPSSISLCGIPNDLLKAVDLCMEDLPMIRIRKNNSELDIEITIQPDYSAHIKLENRRLLAGMHHRFLIVITQVSEAYGIQVTTEAI